MRTVLFGINSGGGDAIPRIDNAHVTAWVEARGRTVNFRGVDIPPRHTIPVRWSGTSRLDVRGPATIRAVQIVFDAVVTPRRNVESRFNASYWSRGGWEWEYKGLEVRRLRGRPIWVSHPEHPEDSYWAREIVTPWAPIVVLGQRSTQATWQRARDVELAGKGN